MVRVAVVTDSTASLPARLADALGSWAGRLKNNSTRLVDGQGAARVAAAISQLELNYEWQTLHQLPGGLDGD